MSSPELNPFELSEVIRNVCHHLPCADLLTCSELNKSWYFESRIQLRDHCEVIADLRDDSCCCKTVKIFNDQLANMRIVPFKGIRVKLEDEKQDSGNHESKCLGTTDVEKLYKSIIFSSKFPLKSLSLHCFLNKDRRDVGSINCPMGKLVIKLLELYGETLEYLEVVSMPTETTFLLAKDEMEGGEPPVIHLPNLKTFECYGHYYRDCPLFLLLEILHIAPNLANLDVELGPQLLWELPPEAFKTTRKLHYSPFDENDVEIYGKLASADPKLTDLDGEFNFTFDFLMEEVRDGVLENAWNHLMRIIRSSSETLEWIGGDSTLMIMLAFARCPPLPKVNGLHLTIPWNAEELDALIPLLQRVDFNKLFPSVKRVEMCAGNEYFYQFQRQQFYQRFTLPATVPLNSNITEIHLEELNKTDVVISHLVSLFPRVTKFAYRRPHCEIDFPMVWGSVWPKLRKLSIGGELNPVNLDAVICGIHPEEANLLRGESMEFLQHVQIVSIAPAVDRLKDLQYLDMLLDWKIDMIGDEKQPGISAVTSILLLQRMPNLKMDFFCPREAPKEYVSLLTSLTQVTVNEYLTREDSDEDSDEE